MALGEYVSVGGQRDPEIVRLAHERKEPAESPEEELAEPAAIHEAEGLSATTARQAAVELTEHDAPAAHLEAELHMSEDDLANPWQAAAASAMSFTIGALLPLLGITH